MSAPLNIYLRDHLVGANFAIELLETWSDDALLPGLKAWAAPLREEISADRDTLKEIIKRLDEPSHPVKEKLGWLAEKISRFKLSHRQPPELAHFEGLEILALGILGKMALWDALGILAAEDSRLAGFDYTRLREDAHAQHARVESRRRQFVGPAFSNR